MEATSVYSQAPRELFFGLAVSERPFVEGPQPLCELSAELLIVVSPLHKVLD